jgi:hypothetical protein
MKHIAGTALNAGTGFVLVGACAALLVGQNDIRRFRRINSM